MKYNILAELRENYPSLIKGTSVYNDYVSKKSMTDLCDAINRVGFECTYFGGMKELLSAYLEHTDISNTIFINYNYGLPAPYKRTQSPVLLELMNAKYSGADPFVALLVNDKEFTKKVLRSVNVLTPRSMLVFNAEGLYEKLNLSKIQPPLVVKPNCEGSSLGILSDSLCDSYNNAVLVTKKLLPQFREVIIEQYIAGYECTVWLIGNPKKFLLVAPLLISDGEKYFFYRRIFTMHDKANHVRQYHRPEEILNVDRILEIKQMAKKIFAELGLRDYARIDFRITEDSIYFIEANALPIFSRTSEIGSIEQLYEITYDDICRLVVDAINSRLVT